MDFNIEKVTITLTGQECWEIGCSLIQDITSDYNLKHWKSIDKSFSEFEGYHKESIARAKKFSSVCNQVWVDDKLREFEEKLNNNF